MTGYSWSLPYAKKLVGAMLILGGAFLLMEHLFTFGGFDIELLGHEYLGILMIIIAFLMNMKWKQLPAVILAFRSRHWLKLVDEGERV